MKRSNSFSRILPIALLLSGILLAAVRGQNGLMMVLVALPLVFEKSCFQSGPLDVGSAHTSYSSCILNRFHDLLCDPASRYWNSWSKLSSRQLRTIRCIQSFFALPAYRGCSHEEMKVHRCPSPSLSEVA
jgi:hypothetical protein